MIRLVCCIFNVLSILGLSSLVAPLESNGIRDVDLYWMVGLSVLLLGCYGVYLSQLWP